MFTFTSCCFKTWFKQSKLVGSYKSSIGVFVDEMANAFFAIAFSIPWFVTSSVICKIVAILL